MTRTPDNSAVLRVARRLDREETAEHLLTVKCFKKSARPQSMRKPYNRLDPSERQVRVVVRDVDDNAPTFPAARANLTLGVRLNVPVDTSLVTLEAEDADADAAPMRYWLADVAFHPMQGQAGPTAEQVRAVFRLDEKTGELRTATAMHQYVDGHFALRVAATNVPDGNSSHRRANASVKVEVTLQYASRFYRFRTVHTASWLSDSTSFLRMCLLGLRRARPRVAEICLQQATIRRTARATRIPAPGGESPAAAGPAQRV